jgi:replicative DNA helicase
MTATVEKLDPGLAREARSNEMAVLGAMLSAQGDSREVLASVREILRPGEHDSGVGEHHFTYPAHKLVWKTVVALLDEGTPCDMHGVVAALPADGLRLLNNGTYLVELSQACLNPLSGPYYAKAVAEATAARKLAEVGAMAGQLAASTALNEVDDAIDLVRSSLDRIVVPGRAGSMVPWEVLGPDTFQEMERLQLLAEQPPGQNDAVFSTGWADLDRLLGPIAPGTMIVIAARPGLGKSVAGRGIAQHLAMRKGQPALLFSLEMSRMEIGLCMMSAGARIPLAAIKNGKLSDEDWVEGARYLGQQAQAPLEVDDSAGTSLAGVDRALAAATRKYGRPPAAYIFDYLQLGQEPGRPVRQEEVSMMSRGHKLLPKKHGTVSVVLSQLNRGPEGRADKLPLLSDLRESGSIEQDADIVILLHRDDYYDKESPRAGEIDLIVAKNRGGPTDTITLAAQLHKSRLVDMAIP